MLAPDIRLHIRQICSDSLTPQEAYRKLQSYLDLIPSIGEEGQAEAAYELTKSFNDRTPRVGVSVFIVKDGKRLVGTRKGSHCSGMKQNPGGRQEYGKTLVQTAIDEVFQETGLRISIVPCPSPDPRLNKESWFLKTEDIFPNDRVHFHTFWFLGHILDLDPVPQNREPDKCSGWVWMSWQDQLVYLNSLPKDQQEIQRRWWVLNEIEPFRHFLGL
jgi:8-oxo-dGTP diphosphatase